MCIVFWATPPPSSSSSTTASSPQYSFILAANRDEYLERPTRDAEWHLFEDPPSSTCTATSPTEPSSNSPSSTGPTRDKNFLCGRDLGDPSFGTWLGMSRNGRLGVLTNVHHEAAGKPAIPAVPKLELAGGGADGVDGDKDKAENMDQVHESHPPQHPNSGNDTPPFSAKPATQAKTLSRGRLIKDYLVESYSSSMTSEDAYLKALSNKRSLYNGFNLLLFNLSRPTTPEGYYHSNYAPPPPPTMRTFQLNDIMMRRGGISNTVLDEPWEKVVRGEKEMKELLDGSGVWENKVAEGDVVEQLMDLMGQTRPVSTRSDLPHTIAVPLCEIPLPDSVPTAAHIAHGEHPFSTRSPSRPDSPTHSSAVEYHPAERPYGTRLTTVILVKTNGDVIFVERDRLRLIRLGDGEDGWKVVLDGKEDRVFRFKIQP